MGSFKACVDGNGDGVICRFAKRTDPLNELTQWVDSAIEYAAWETTDSGAVHSIITSVWGYPDAKFFGKNIYSIAAGVNTAGMYLWSDGGNYDIAPTIAGKVYRVVYWAKVLSGASSASLRTRLYSLNNTVSEGSITTAINDTTWTQITLNVTPSTSDNLTLRMEKLDAAAITFLVSGFMFYETDAPITAPDGYNTGVASDLYDDLSSDVMGMSWQIGMRKAYQGMMDDGVATLNLLNTDTLYTPENASSALYGLLLPGRMVEIGHWLGTANTGYRTMFSGQLGKPAIQVNWGNGGAYAGKQTVSLSVVSGKRLLDSQTVELLEPGVVPVTNVISGALFLTGGLYGNFTSNLAQSAESVANYTPSSDAAVWQIIEDMVTVENGKFYIDRGGTIQFINKYYSTNTVSAGSAFYNWGSGGTVATTPIGTITQDGTYKPYGDPLYSYGVEYLNSVRVTVQPRQTGPSGTVWQMDDNAYTIPANATRRFICRLRDSMGRFTSCASVTATGATFSAGTVTISASAEGSKAVITLDNTAGAISAVLTGLALTGTPSTQVNAITYEATNEADIELYGVYPYNLTVQAAGSVSYAEDRANFILNRDGNFAGYFAQVAFRNTGDGTLNAHQLAWEMGKQVVMDIDNYSHNKTYWIVGERHEVTLTGVQHDTAFMLEPKDNTTAWLLETTGYSELEVSTRLG